MRKKSDILNERNFSHHRMLVRFHPTVLSGFSVAPITEPENLLFVRFLNKEVMRSFEEFTKPSNLKKGLGKRIVCDCFGVIVPDIGGGRYFVKEAVLNFQEISELQ